MRVPKTLAPNRARHWSPGPVRRLLRRPRWYWGLVVTLAGVSAVSLAIAQHDVEAALARYGTNRPTLVATGAIARGDSLAGRTEVVDIPVAFRPADALERPPASPGIAAHDLGVGQIVTTTAVADDRGPAAGEAVLALARSPLTPAVMPGDRVLVVMAADPLAGSTPGTIAAIVHTVTDEAVQIVVATDDLVMVSSAVRQGNVALALGG